MRWVALLIILFAPVAWTQEARPTVISLDYCADQFVLGLADREQILGVSMDAEKPFSHLRARAAGLRQVRASAEDVIALQPDLVIRSWGGDARALGFYERFGIRVHQIGYAVDFEGVARETRAVAMALHQVERGDALIAGMPDASPDAGRSALYMTPGGFTAGTQTLVGAIMAQAGLGNAAGEGSWQALPLETLLLDPPTFALTAFFGFGTDKADHWSLTHHPVLRNIMAGADTLSMTESRITCPTWLVGDEVRSLRVAIEGQGE